MKNLTIVEFQNKYTNTYIHTYTQSDYITNTNVRGSAYINVAGPEGNETLSCVLQTKSYRSVGNYLDNSRKKSVRNINILFYQLAFSVQFRAVTYFEKNFKFFVLLFISLTNFVVGNESIVMFFTVSKTMLIYYEKEERGSCAKQKKKSNYM